MKTIIKVAVGVFIGCSAYSIAAMTAVSSKAATRWLMKISRNIMEESTNT